MAAYDSSRSSELRSNSDDEEGSRRDSHDLSLANARHRESLLDNLLLSFDKIGDGIGPFGGPETSPFFSTVDEVDDNDSLYSRHSRRGRTGSVGATPGGYSLQYPQRVRPDPDFGYEQEGGSFGVTYGSSDRELRSRGGRALNSSHGSFGGGYSNGFEYDSAPAPSIRTRNRTPSPPRSPCLVRRSSNRSIKSLHQNQAFQPPEQFALPPLPAFASPPPQAASPMAAQTKPSKPGFFRRVFGGGSSNSNGNSSSKAPTSSGGNPPATPPTHAPMSDPVPPSVPTQQVITKKSSFFRRRKKSVSDVNQHPMPHPPLPAPIKTDSPPNVDFDGPPTSSLRNAMKPYIPSPSWNTDAHYDLRTPSLPAQNATIRTVASSEAISGRQPSSFYGDGSRKQNSTHGSVPDNVGNKYKKDGWNSRSGTASGEPSPLGMDNGDRPSTSPQAPPSLNRTFYQDDDDEREYMWPQPPPHVLRSNGRALDNGRQQRPRQPSIDSFKDLIIPNGREYDRQCVEEGAASPRDLEKKEQNEEQKYEDEEQNIEERERERDKLNLDTSVRSPRSGVDQSWFLSTASPLTTNTPTVTLQCDGQQSVVLDQDENASKKDTDTESVRDGEFTSKELDIAHKIFHGDEEIVAKDKAAAWLGDPGPERLIVRKAFMSLFDWAGMNILVAFRSFCTRLVFKGEAQQVDRIIDEISQRWCQCNPNHGFKNSDVVHTILYSILLLNTDLHIAEIPNSQRMTRGQFLKNTMATIRRVMEEFAIELAPVKSRTRDGDDKHTSTQTASSGTRSSTPFQGEDDDETQLSSLHSMSFPMPANHKSHTKRPSLDFGRGNRMSRIGNLSPRLPLEDNDKDFEMDGGLALVKGPISGGIKVWETQVEIVLKDFYQSIKAQALPLHGSTEVVAAPQNSLSVFGSGGMLRRSPSTISKAPSELSVAGRPRDMSGKSSKDWTVRNRSRQRVYNGSYAGSSRTSLEERSSIWSPSASSTWSKYSLNKTQTSMSVDSLGSVFTHGDYQQSIGFANALSHAIIREEAASGHSGEEGDLDVLLDGDDELELAGAPWAKEGLLKHKHHLEGADKRAKNRNWTESFAVIQRGYMRLFQFPSRGSSKTSNSQVINGVVGGGNWTENAEPIGSFLLRQTIASALPPPGYSKTRPHVWALSLPSGAVHFFEVGTADIVKEFVTTANYWSARLSKEPLIGGVSNVEYGWGESVIDPEILTVGTSSPPQSRNSDFGQGRPSLQMSIRSSLDQAGGFRPRLPGDKVNIKDWSPPTQSMVASNLKEIDQLRALESYVANIEADLMRHNELRSAMMLAFSPRHPNYTRALNNWEQKSKYLLKEIIKFRTYIETLQAAIAKRQAIVADKLKVPSLPGDGESTKSDQEPAAEVVPEYEEATPKSRK